MYLAINYTEVAGARCDKQWALQTNLFKEKTKKENFMQTHAKRF